ncbi:MAG: FAD-dependent oxidoreductase [Gammaproteobacteria bacterium SG8_30]|nr:MAG: FAD-dependent oxidoreductase [Gammaproteobacteria bacterium SG8_30]
MMEVETVVIGAGVVGLACARALALAGREVIVLERAAHVGTETSSRNSEVIHSGIYYPPGSLKARLCVAGRDMLYAYCRERAIPHRRLGKLIVATSDAETGILARYHELAGRNGIGEVSWKTADEVRELEPEVRCVRALHVPETGIVDSHSLMTSLWGDLQAAGGDVAFLSAVTGGRRRPDERFELELEESDERLVCNELVNSAGLHAPDLARRLEGCGKGAIPQAYYARGHYFTLSGKSPFSRLVYPIAESAGLGIHVTLDLSGRAKFGPDVDWVPSPDYSFDESRRDPFAQAIRRYYPALDDTRLQPDYTGIRPKIAPPEAPAADFRIDAVRQHGIPGLVHLFGIESPGLTSAFAIAADVSAVLTGQRPRTV